MLGLKWGWICTLYRPGDTHSLHSSGENCLIKEIKYFLIERPGALNLYIQCVPVNMIL